MPRGDGDTLGGLGGVTMVSIGAADPIELPAISTLDYAEQNLTGPNGVDDVTLSWYEDARSRYGEVVELRNGSKVLVGDTVGEHPVGRYSARGLDQLRDYHKDLKTGLVTCRFYDGAAATVDADCTRSACDCGASFCSHRVAAVYCALGLMTGDNLPKEVEAHRDAFKHFLLNRDDNEALTAAAAHGATALAASDVHVQFLDPAEVDPIELPDTPYARKPKNVDKVRRRVRSARRLGLPIYDPTKLVYTWDQTLNQTIDACAVAMKSNPNGMGFTACLYGPPSTGKSFIGKLLAAERCMPMYEVNLGQNADLEMFLGTQGLENGDTVIHQGPLTKAATADGGCVIVLNEFVNIHEDQTSLLHDMVGSGGPGEERFITIAAPSGADEEAVRIPVHNDTIFILTYNPGKSGRRVTEAIESRCVMVEVDALAPDEEAERLAAQVYASIGRMMSKDTGDPKTAGGWTFDPTKTRKGPKAKNPATGAMEDTQLPPSLMDQIPELKKECTRAVAAWGKLRKAYEKDDLTGYPDFRTMQQFVRTVILKRHMDQIGVTPEERPRKAVDAAIGLIQHFGDLGDTSRERRELITSLIKSEYKEELQGAASK